MNSQEHTGHPIATCNACKAAWEFTELCASVNLEEGTCDREREGTLCPTCGQDLAHEIALHIEVCRGEKR